MNDERIIPINADASVVTTSMLVDGTELPPTYEVRSISTTKEVNRIPRARIVFRDGDAAQEDFPLSNAPELVPGKTVEVKAGYASQEETLFKGIIITQRIEIRERTGPVLVVECRDESVKMTAGRKCRAFADVTDSSVIEDLIGEYGLEADVEATSLEHKELVQFHATDWDFMLSRADANGRFVIADDGTVQVKAPDLSGSAELAVIYGDTIYDLQAEMDARHQYASVTASAWDYAGQSVLTQDGSAPAAYPQGNVGESDLAATLGLDELALRHTGQVVDAELKAWADAQLVKSTLGKIVGQVKVQGNALLKPGQMMELNGLGDRFTGPAYAAGVRHEVVGGAWYTHVQFGVPPDWFYEREGILDPPAAGLVPAVHGLQIGVVTALEGDPDGEDRIRVRVPILDPEGDGLWARVAAPDAGSERGVIFRPEIDDEVIVGFLNADPRDPIVLGALFSSAKPAPIPPSDDNHEKGIVTRSNLRVHFNDETSVVTVETPGGNVAVLSDDEEAITLTDQHGNSITMNSDGITLDGSTITLTAQQEVVVEAGTDLTAEGGANVNLSAGAQLKAEGSAGAELSTSAIATIKGSLVQIN
jgi:Rhs element Vgr protein